MRVIITLFLLSLLLGCKKEKKDKPAYAQFTGTWEYEKHVGFLTDSLPSGNGHILHLNSNGLFERRQQDTVLYRGSYVIQEKADCFPRENPLFFSSTDTALVWDNYIAITNGKLTLTTPNCLMDGGTTFYRKVDASNR